MRKILLLFFGFIIALLVLLSLFPLLNSTFAMTKEVDNRCYYCPSKDDGFNSYYVNPYPNGPPDGSMPGPACGYTPLPIGPGSFEQVEPATPDDKSCSKDRCDDLQGCLDVDNPPACSPKTGTCNSEDDSQCRPNNTCTNNYCVVTINGVLYQYTADYYSRSGKVGICKTLSSPPRNAPKCADIGQACGGDVKCCSQEARCATTRELGSATIGTCKLKPTNIKPPCGTDLGGGVSRNQDVECNDGVFSALGITIPTKPLELIPKIIEVILGFAGAIVIILIIRSGYKLMFSQGNPEKVQEARDELTSAIVGLLFIIFSFVLLQFILNDVLNIENLPKGQGL